MSNSTEEIERELTGLKEMLGAVLITVGEPVRVTKESLKVGFPDGSEIYIDEETDAFVFGVRSR